MVGAVVVGVRLQLIRSSGVPVWDSFWSEDGRFFYGAAKHHSLWRTLFEPLGGYLQVVPRILSALAATLPVADGAWANATLAALTCALLGLYVFTATDQVLPHTWQRIAVAAVLVLNPAAAYEVNAAANNLHWFFMLAAFWACWSRSTSPRRISLDTIIVVLAALSDPLTGLLLPLVGWRAWRGSRAARSMTTGLVLALALQYWFGLAGRTPGHRGDRDLTALPGLYGLRVAGSFLLGDRGLPSWWPAHGSGWWVPVLALLLVGAGMALAVWFARRHERRLLIGLLAYSVIFLAAPMLTRGGASGYLRHPFTLHGSRYMIVPLTLLYSALFVAVGLPWRLPDRLRGRLLPALAVLMVVLELGNNFTTSGPRTSGTSWRKEVQAARAICTGHPSDIPSGLRQGLIRPRIYRGILQIPVPPFNREYFWAVQLRCGQVD